MSSGIPDPALLSLILQKRENEQRQRERERSLLMAEERQRQARADQAFENALRFSQNPDFDVQLILPRLQELGASPGQIGMVEAAGKATKAAAKRTELEGQIGARARIAVGAPRTQAANQAVALIATLPDPQARADLLNQLGVRMEQERLRAAGQLPAQVAAEAADVRSVRRREEADIRGLQRQEFAQIRAEERGERRRSEGAAVDDYSRILSGEQRGEISPAASTAAFDSLVSEFGDKRAFRITREARRRASSDLVTQARKDLSPAELSDDVRLARVVAKGFTDPTSLTPDEQGLLIIKKQGNFDPATNTFIVSPPGAGEQFWGRRNSLAALDHLLVQAEQTAEDVVRDVGQGRALAGGLAGTNFVQTALRLSGNQAGSVARFSTFGQAMLIKVARMDQDARLSDFDLKLWMAALPSLVDLGVGADGQMLPQARERFAAVRELLDLEKSVALGSANAERATQRARELRQQIEADPEVERRVNIVRELQGKEGQEISAYEAGIALRKINRGPGARPAGIRSAPTVGAPTTLQPGLSQKFQEYDR